MSIPTKRLGALAIVVLLSCSLLLTARNVGAALASAETPPENGCAPWERVVRRYLTCIESAICCLFGDAGCCRTFEECLG